MNELKSKIFTQKRFIKHSKKLFIKVLEYVVFCYIRLKNDNENGKVYYSKSYCTNNTSHHFEDYLKIEFVENYLQNKKEDFNDKAILSLDFQWETQKIYWSENKRYVDKIDIFVSNLGLTSNWIVTKREDIYFAIECKRLKNTSNNNLYISDIQKFIERKYNFRFPFETMVGFVEKSSISIDEIIQDINCKLDDHPVIKTNHKLIPFQIEEDFNECRFSEHEKNLPKTILIEIYHLFFDYSKIIIE